MRIKKDVSKIVINPRTEKIQPFRSFHLTEYELEKVNALPRDEEGRIRSNKSSENLLKEILKTRGMESLLYPDKDDWSGYVKVFDDGLFWML